MTEAVQRVLLDHAVDLAGPIRDAAASPAAAAAFLEDLGWDLLGAAGLPQATLTAALAAAKQAVDEAAAARDAAADDLAAVGSGLLAVGRAVNAVRGLGGWAPPADLPGDLLATFASDAGAQLLDGYLARATPRLRAALLAFGAIRVVDAPAITRGDGTVVRRARRRPLLDTDALTRLVTDPVGSFRERYVVSGGAPQAAEAVAEALFPVLAEALAGAGLPVAYGRSGLAADPTATAGQRAAAARLLRVVLPAGDGTARAAAQVTLGLVDDAGRLRLVVAPAGEAAVAYDDGRWSLAVSVAGTVAPFAVDATGVAFLPGAPAGASLTASAEGRRAGTGGQPVVRLGTADGTRLEIGSLTVGAAGTFSAGPLDARAYVELGGTRLVVAAGDGDGFLRMVLPATPMVVDLPLALEWSGKGGWHLRGAPGIAVDLPVGIAVGPVSVPVVHVDVRAGEGGTLTVTASLDASLRLGPVQASVAGLGLRAEIGAGAGAFGAVDVRLGLKPPDGVGLAVDAGPVSGGGFLYCDAAKGQYAGAVHVEVAGFLSLKAVGLLNTKMPDGSPIRMPDGREGYSLLVIVAGEFPPIQLGFGFTLNGVGGLVGINRTVDVDVLRAGVKTRALDSVMFPPDPVANAPAIIATLSRVFPVAPGRYVFGPMVRLGWGSPTLLTIDAGLVLELPSPVRLLILGRMRLALPSEQAPVVSVNLDVLGVVDVEQGEVSVDATLYDSSVAGFVLTGDMALRARWKGDTTFALSAGGFHPSFTPPPGFPALRRMEIALASGGNPRLSLQAYLALTSNTAQLGARLSVWAEALGFTASGVLSFDALLQFTPFHLRVEVNGAVELRRGDTSVCAITLYVSLTGPAPWRARGRGVVHVLGAEVEVRFDVTVGRAEAPPLPAPVDLADALRTALADPRSWTAQLPPRGEGGFTLRDVTLPAGTILAHPLGGLSVTQRVLPLGVALEQAGNAPIAGETRFDLKSVRYGTRSGPGTPLTDAFARAQFFRLSDDAKLSAPSFERFEAGRSVVTAALARDDTAAPRDLTYRTIVVDEPDPGATPLSDGDLRLLAAGGAAAAAATRHGGAARFAGTPVALTVAEPAYAVAAAGEEAVAGGAGTTYTEALAALAAARRAGGADDLRVVPVRRLVAP